MRLPLLPYALLVLVLAGCTAAPDPELVGSWRIYTSNAYDSEGNFLPASTSRSLELYADSSWAFGSSSGTWDIQPIENSDWVRWQTDSYGPTRKLVLYGWDGGTADGPIEESNRVDFIWIIYDVDLGGGLQQAQIKFGRWNP